MEWLVLVRLRVKEFSAYRPQDTLLSSITTINFIKVALHDSII